MLKAAADTAYGEVEFQGTNVSITTDGTILKFGTSALKATLAEASWPKVEEMSAQGRELVNKQEVTLWALASLPRKAFEERYKKYNVQLIAQPHGENREYMLHTQTMTKVEANDEGRPAGTIPRPFINLQKTMTKKPAAFFSIKHVEVTEIGQQSLGQLWQCVS